MEQCAVYDQRITNDSEAEQALQTVLAARAERDRLLDLAAQEMARIESKSAAIDEAYERDTAFIMAELERYFDTVQAKETKTQRSYQLLSGKLIRKKSKVQPKRDDASLLVWAKEHAPEFVKSTESVLWGEIKPFLVVDGDTVVYSETGEIVDALTVETTPSTFEVK